MKGRPRDPTRTKRRTGNRRKPDEAPKATLVRSLPVDKPPAPPADLPKDAHAMWNVAVGELYHRGLRPADYEALRQMCIAALRARQAGDMIDKYGMLVEGERGPMVNPLLKAERDSTATYLRLAEQFGLTFASRLRLGLMQLAGESILGTLNRELSEH